MLKELRAEVLASEHVTAFGEAEMRLVTQFSTSIHLKCKTIVLFLTHGLQENQPCQGDLFRKVTTI